jgi:hypothetical protein
MSIQVSFGAVVPDTLEPKVLRPLNPYRNDEAEAQLLASNVWKTRAPRRPLHHFFKELRPSTQKLTVKNKAQHVNTTTPLFFTHEEYGAKYKATRSERGDYGYDTALWAYDLIECPDAHLDLVPFGFYLKRPMSGHPHMCDQDARVIDELNERGCTEETLSAWVKRDNHGAVQYIFMEYCDASLDKAIVVEKDARQERKYLSDKQAVQLAYAAFQEAR